MDLSSGNVIALERFESAVQEVFAVAAVPGRRFAALIDCELKLHGELLRPL